MSEALLAALLLTNRLVDAGAKPYSAGEFWELLARVPDPSVLMRAGVDAVEDLAQVDGPEAARIVQLLSAASAFAFERERLEEEGILVLSALDDRFPSRLRERLGTACPSFLTVAGPVEWLSHGGLGVVGSRDASDAALAVAREAAAAAVEAGRAVVSGLARGVDQAAMAGALDAGGPVIGIPPEGLRVAAKSPEVRRRVHRGELCIASPYAPDARFSAGNALGRNKIIYALADVTLVVCAEDGSGGTWEGAKEALRRRFGTVAVWTGESAGPGNAPLVRMGGAPVDDVRDVFSGRETDALAPPASQEQLF